MGKTIQDLIVTGFGIATSVLTAFILALVETKFGIAVYSFMLWFVIPVGALFAGFAAASGYYFGAKLFNHRPTSLVLFNTISVALSTYFLLNYLNYSFIEIKGQSLSDLVPFAQYMDIVLSHQSMEFRFHGAKLGETGDLGSLGYITAALQVIGFAVGGLAVYGHLRSEPYCDLCNKYLKKRSSIARYTSDTGLLAQMHSNLLTELKAGNTAGATQLILDFGSAAQNALTIKVELKLWKCVSCPQEFFESSVSRWNGKDWKQVSDLLLREYLPGVRIPAKAITIPG